jgi:hypothetical protein
MPLHLPLKCPQAFDLQVLNNVLPQNLYLNQYPQLTSLTLYSDPRIFLSLALSVAYHQNYHDFSPIESPIFPRLLWQAYERNTLSASYNGIVCDGRHTPIGFAQLAQVVRHPTAAIHQFPKVK